MELLSWETTDVKPVDDASNEGVAAAGLEKLEVPSKTKMGENGSPNIARSGITVTLGALLMWQS